MRTDIWVAVALGGAGGSLARHGVNLVLLHAAGRPAPYATAIVNLLGAAVIGLLAGLIASGRLTLTPPVQAFVFVGLLGGFTTFSSFVLDTLVAAQAGGRALAMSNVLVQTLGGLVLVGIGYAVGSR